MMLEQETVARFKAGLRGQVITPEDSSYENARKVHNGMIDRNPAIVARCSLHLSSWGGVCPGNDESAGKRRSGRTTKGNPYFRATLNQSAWASARRKQSEFEARYHYLQPKLKHKGAIVGMAHALVYAIYNVLVFGRPYQPPRIEGLDEQQTRRLIRHHSKRLKKLQVWLPKAPKVSDGAKVLGKLKALVEA